MDLDHADPHWFGCPGYGFVLGIRIQIQEHWNWQKLANKPGFLSVNTAFVPSQLCLLTYLLRDLLQVYFSCKNSTFCDVRVWKNPDPHWFGSLDPYPHGNEKLDTDPHWNQCGSTTLKKSLCRKEYLQSVGIVYGYRLFSLAEEFVLENMVLDFSFFSVRSEVHWKLSAFARSSSVSKKLI